MRTLGSVPWKRRSDVRHILQGVISQLDQFRTDMVHEELNADGAVAEIEDIMAELNVVRDLVRDQAEPDPDLDAVISELIGTRKRRNMGR